jgi:hypothetical protein
LINGVWTLFCKNVFDDMYFIDSKLPLKNRLNYVESHYIARIWKLITVKCLNG